MAVVKREMPRSDRFCHLWKSSPQITRRVASHRYLHRSSRGWLTSLAQAMFCPFSTSNFSSYIDWSVSYLVSKWSLTSWLLCCVVCFVVKVCTGARPSCKGSWGRPQNPRVAESQKLRRESCVRVTSEKPIALQSVLMNIHNLGINGKKIPWRFYWLVLREDL